MTNEPGGELKDLRARIGELNEKSTQMLLFLSFAIVGAATLNAHELPANPALVRCAIWWWMVAVFPVLVGVLPAKEFWRSQRRWYRGLVWLKFVVLWAAVLLSAMGALQLVRAVW